MANKKVYEYPEIRMTDNELIGIILHMWINDLIQCENRSLVLDCLGLKEIDEKLPLLPDRRVDIDTKFIKEIVDDGYMMVVKKPSFFRDHGALPDGGLMVIHRDIKKLYCMEETVNYLRQRCNSINVELVEVESTEPTYFFRTKS